MSAGLVQVIVGFNFVTERVAAVDVAEPTVLVNTARYLFPLWFPFVVKLKVVDVAPAMSANAPPPALTCHCTVGVGNPLAAAVNVAVDSAATIWSTGFVEMTGAAVLVSEKVAINPLMVAVTLKDPPVPFAVN